MSKKGKKNTPLLNLLANIIWLIFGGLIAAVVWFVIGLILCITIVGIPFGLQCFKIAEVTLTPFGKKVNIAFEKHPIMNILWAIFVGWELFIGYLFAGMILCITIIGIPFGVKIFHFSPIALLPFGAKVN